MPNIEDAILAAAYEHDVLKVRETDGPNDSPRIREYLKSVGISFPAPWCAAFVTWCLVVKAGYSRRDLPIKAASTCAWAAWAKNKGLLSNEVAVAKRGDLFVWCEKGLGHIGFIIESKKFAGTWWLRTIEGNSNEDGSREGTMVTRRGTQGKMFPLGWRRWTSKMRIIRMTELH